MSLFQGLSDQYLNKINGNLFQGNFGKNRLLFFV